MDTADRFFVVVTLLLVALIVGGIALALVL